MDNLKQKIDAEIGGPKWNDALSEAIQQRAKKKSIPAYGIVTFCTLALACFLLVLNWQPAETTPTVQTGDITSIQLKELYVANGDLPQHSFNTKQSTLYLNTNKINATDLHEFNAIFANMHSTTTGYPSYFDFWYQKDLLAVDANNQPWRLKLFVFDDTYALLFDVDSETLYEYKNEQIGTDNPLSNVVYIFDNLALKPYSYLYMLSFLLINLFIQLIFKVKFNIPFNQKTFEDSHKNKIFTTIEIAILVGFAILISIASFLYIPAIILVLFILFGVRLFITYHVQTKLYFIRELLRNSVGFTIFCILLFTI